MCAWSWWHWHSADESKPFKHEEEEKNCQPSRNFFFYSFYFFIKFPSPTYNIVLWMPNVRNIRALTNAAMAYDITRCTLFLLFLHDLTYIFTPSCRWHLWLTAVMNIDTYLYCPLPSLIRATYAHSLPHPRIGSQLKASVSHPNHPSFCTYRTFFSLNIFFFFHSIGTFLSVSVDAECEARVLAMPSIYCHSSSIFIFFYFSFSS